MEISAEKTKLVTNSANGTQRKIKVKEQKLGTVTSLNYLGAVVSDIDVDRRRGGKTILKNGRKWTF